MLAESLTAMRTLQVPQQVQVALNYPPFDHRPGRHHLDGASPPEPDGRPRTFTLLVGVLLSDQPSDDMGNLWVWPGMHLTRQAFFREHGSDALLGCGGYPPIALPAPVQVRGRAGGSAVGPLPAGPQHRRQHLGEGAPRRLLSRQRVDHALRWRQFLQDAWLDYDAVRDALT